MFSSVTTVQLEEDGVLAKSDHSYNLFCCPIVDFYTQPHNSGGGILWFHVGRPCVCPSVSHTYVCPFFISE